MRRRGLKGLAAHSLARSLGVLNCVPEPHSLFLNFVLRREVGRNKKRFPRLTFPRIPLIFRDKDKTTPGETYEMTHLRQILIVGMAIGFVMGAIGIVSLSAFIR